MSLNRYVVLCVCTCRMSLLSKIATIKYVEKETLGTLYRHILVWAKSSCDENYYKEFQPSKHKMQ